MTPSATLPCNAAEARGAGHLLTEAPRCRSSTETSTIQARLQRHTRSCRGLQQTVQLQMQGLQLLQRVGGLLPQLGALLQHGLDLHQPPGVSTAPGLTRPGRPQQLRQPSHLLQQGAGPLWMLLRPSHRCSWSWDEHVQAGEQDRQCISALPWLPAEVLCKHHQQIVHTSCLLTPVRRLTRARAWPGLSWRDCTTGLRRLRTPCWPLVGLYAFSCRAS